MNTETTIDAARQFEAVALAFAEDLARREAGTLALYLARYPRYAHELSLLAFESAASEVLPVEPLATPTPLRERLRADARAALLREPAAAAATSAPAITSLLGRARAHAGLAPRALARQLGIGTDVLAVLEERHVAPDTVPAPFLERLAGALGASVEAVRAYLAGPPLTAARGVAYHAPRGHTPPRRISFEEAIAQSNLTTPEQKAYWLDGLGGGEAE